MQELARPNRAGFPLLLRSSSVAHPLIREDAACSWAGSESGDGEFITPSNGKTTRMPVAFQMVAQSSKPTMAI
jgi:hypothetical protein